MRRGGELERRAVVGVDRGDGRVDLGRARRRASRGSAPAGPSARSARSPPRRRAPRRRRGSPPPRRRRRRRPRASAPSSAAKRALEVRVGGVEKLRHLWSALPRRALAARRSGLKHAVGRPGVRSRVNLHCHRVNAIRNIIFCHMDSRSRARATPVRRRAIRLRRRSRRGPRRRLPAPPPAGSARSAARARARRAPSRARSRARRSCGRPAPRSPQSASSGAAIRRPASAASCSRSIEAAAR